MHGHSYSRNDTNIADERLAAALYSRARYIPLLLSVSGLGFIAIYVLTILSILGEPTPQLLYISGITLVFAAAEIPILKLAQRKRGISANLYTCALAGIFAVFLTGFWDGVVPVTLLIAVLPAIAAIRNGLPRKYLPTLLALLGFVGIGIFYVNAAPPIDRLQNNSAAALASVVFLLATGLLLVTISFISQRSRFRSLQSLLLTAFVIIVTIATVMTAILSAIGAYTNSQTQIFNSLEAVTILKLNQIESLLSDSRNDTETLLADPRFITNTLEALEGVASNALAEESLRRTSRTRMVDVLGAEEEAYNEIMVLDVHGTVIISTMQSREGSSLSAESFFQHGLYGFHAEFAKPALFGTENLVVAAPIIDRGNVVRGALILRSNAATIKEIMEDTPGFREVETYMVNLDFQPVTSTRVPADSIETEAATNAIRNQASGVRSIYHNYAGEQVLGYQEWFAPMQLAVIAEVPLSFVVSSSIQALAGSALLALFVVIVAIVAVIISARTIADPLKALVETTQSFAAGRLSARAVVERGDEIGALAQAYNQMAAQLQEMIGKLEQRVADRTRDLEGQTFRLRVVAEIARDATAARDVAELLTRTAELICNRFGFYHAGIFLLDKNREYAVLVASPTAAGKQMIENNHRLRVGEVGIVGRVAATGEPRVTLNTGNDAVYFNNPFLPNTRSEMALPLKVEGRVIGVLDVQSDQLHAFTDDDVAIMQILADQLAVAMERTRLLQEVEINLRELESAYGRFTQDNWTRISESGVIAHKGYRFDNVRIEPVDELPDFAHSALIKGTMISANGSAPGEPKEHKVALPIKLRGQTIGVINLKLKDGYDRSILTIIELATERLAAAMESARLYEEARLRADREQSIARVTTAISASTQYEHILQTTVREIGSILGDTEVAIQILEEPAAEKRVEQRD
ncbi:MAG TPA: GAF domain-containing protein [Anaerolineales bacterium]|nr:GAF domain-containing protein [Anaerolineales bacterium]